MNLEEKEFIMQRMTQNLDNRQMIKLMDTLDDVMKRSEDGILEKSSEELLDVFLAQNGWKMRTISIKAQSDGYIR